MAPGALGAAIDAANGDVGSEFAGLLAAKGMACAVASVALAKRSGTPGLAANGAGNHRRLSQPRQIGHDRCSIKSSIQEQYLDPDSQGFSDLPEQVIQYPDRVFLREDKTHREREARVFHHYVSSCHPVKSRRAIFRFTPHS